MSSPPRVSVIIPALNEEQAIGKVLSDLPDWIREVIVVDNGSTDRTVEVARQHGARIVREPRRGYGAACLAGIAAADSPDVYAFCDGDYSDHVDQLATLVEPIARDRADLVIGSRSLGRVERGALTPPQRFGNWLSTRLVRLGWGVRFTDLGPFRAIRARSLHLLRLDDRDFGWTVQMQARAAAMGMRCLEVPAAYRNRIGTSKISGTVRGVALAGTKILYTIGRAAIRHRRGLLTPPDRIVLFTRYPEPGTTKTRLIPELGARGAAQLQRRMTQHVLDQTAAADRRWLTEVRYAGGDDAAMRAMFGGGVTYTPQGDGELGRRLARAFDEGFAAGDGRIVIIGGDCPGIDAATFDQALDALEQHDVAIGPAGDGGYYLIALRDPQPTLFNGIGWGSEHVLAQTLALAERESLAVAQLDQLDDVDRPADLAIARLYGLLD